MFVRSFFLATVILATVIVGLAGSAVEANVVRRNPAKAHRPVQNVALVRAAYAGKKAALGRSAGDVQTLQQAYQILSTANHDYKGHRIKAMKAIHAAAKLMGTKLKGDGKNKEPQQLSDEQLRGVQKMLQGMRATVHGPSQAKVIQHVDQAIHHLGVALTIK